MKHRKGRLSLLGLSKSIKWERYPVQWMFSFMHVGLFKYKYFFFILEKKKMTENTEQASQIM